MAVFAVTYTLSSLFTGPLISGDAEPTEQETTTITPTTDEHGH